MLHVGYHELLRDPIVNKKAFEQVIQNVQIDMATDAALDLLLGPDPIKAEQAMLPDGTWKEITLQFSN